MDLRIASQEDVIKILEDLLKKALAGEIIEIAGVAMKVSGTYTFYQSRTEDKFKMAGHLLDASMNRLGYTSKN